MSKWGNGEVWIYEKHPLLLPASSRFAVKLQFGGDRPTPTEQFLAGLTCKTCGQLFHDHDEGTGHDFEPEGEGA